MEQAGNRASQQKLHNFLEEGRFVMTRRKEMWSMGTLQFGGGPGGTYVCDLVVQQPVNHMLAHVMSREECV